MRLLGLRIATPAEARAILGVRKRGERRGGARTGGERIESEDLGRRVYRILKTMIIDGELAAGEKLAQEKLAARLGVSRTPLLSAFSRLEQESLVRDRARGGGRSCARYSRDELVHIYDIRCRLEPLGARDAAHRGLRRRPGGPAAAAGGLRRRRAAGDTHALKRTDFDFHMELMRCSGNRFLYDMLATCNIIIIANTKGLLKPAEQSDREHHALMDALEARDPRAGRPDHVRAPQRRAGESPPGVTPAGRAATEELRTMLRIEKRGLSRPRLREAAGHDRRGHPGRRQQGQQAGARASGWGSARRPINDALSRLAGEKLIEQRSRQGFYIRSYTYAELAPLYELRAALEGMAMRLGLERGESGRPRADPSTRSTASTPSRAEDRVGGVPAGRPGVPPLASSSFRATRS